MRVTGTPSLPGVRQLVLDEFDVQLETIGGQQTIPVPPPPQSISFDYYASQDDAPLAAEPLVGSSEGLGVFAMFDDLAGLDFDQPGQADASQPDFTAHPHHDPSHWEAPAGMFVTASNKPAAVPSEAAMKRAAALFGDLLTDSNQEQAVGEGGLPLKDTKAGVANRPLPMFDCPAAQPRDAPLGLFSTGSGRPVHVTPAAMRRAAALLGDEPAFCQSPAAPDTRASVHQSPADGAPPAGEGRGPPLGLFVTASGKHHAVSEAAMQRAQSLLGDVLRDDDDSNASIQNSNACSQNATPVVEHVNEPAAGALNTPRAHIARGRGTIRRAPSISTGTRKRFRSPLLEGRAPPSAAQPNRPTRFALRKKTPPQEDAALRAQRPLRQRLLAAMSSGTSCLGHPSPDATSAVPSLSQLQALFGQEVLGMVHKGLLAAGAQGDVATEAWVLHHMRWV